MVGIEGSPPGRPSMPIGQEALRRQRMLPSPYLWRQYAPPVCAKVIARAKCVQKTRHALRRRKLTGANRYMLPEGSGRGIGKLAAPLSTDFAREQHATCSAPLRLNHYAVRSRENTSRNFPEGGSRAVPGTRRRASRRAARTAAISAKSMREIGRTSSRLMSSAEGDAASKLTTQRKI